MLRLAGLLRRVQHVDDGEERDVWEGEQLKR